MCVNHGWVVLSRKMPLSLEMIRKLHEGLDIPAGILIQPSAGVVV
jgi:antitoxin component HigA of HigAB toxin-antitoxin module